MQQALVTLVAPRLSARARFLIACLACAPALWAQSVAMPRLSP